MIVNDFHIVSIAADPPEADAPLVVDPNTVLIRSIAGELFQSIGRWRSQIVEIDGRIELAKFA